MGLARGRLPQLVHLARGGLTQLDCVPLCHIAQLLRFLLSTGSELVCLELSGLVQPLGFELGLAGAVIGFSARASRDVLRRLVGALEQLPGLLTDLFERAPDRRLWR